MDDLIDQERYPVRDLDSAAATEMLGEARDGLAGSGYAELAGFVNPAGIDLLKEDAEELAHRAHHSAGIGTAYLEQPDLDLPEDHPRRWVGPYSLRAVPYDVMPRSSLLRRLYEWEPLKDLVSAVLGRGPLYPVRRPFRGAESGGDGRRRRAPVALRPDRLRGVARDTDRRDRWELRGLPARADTADERYGDVARVLAGDSPTVSDHRHEPRDAPRVRRPQLDPPREPDIGKNAPPCGPARVLTRERVRPGASFSG